MPTLKNKRLAVREKRSRWITFGTLEQQTSRHRVNIESKTRLLTSVFTCYLRVDFLCTDRHGDWTGVQREPQGQNGLRENFGYLLLPLRTRVLGPAEPGVSEELHDRRRLAGANMVGRRQGIADNVDQVRITRGCCFAIEIGNVTFRFEPRHASRKPILPDLRLEPI